MNVRELMEAPSQFDPETRVVVAGYEEGFNVMLDRSARSFSNLIELIQKAFFLL